MGKINLTDLILFFFMVTITGSLCFVSYFIVTNTFTCHPKTPEKVMYEQQVNEKGEIYFIQVENN